jgi:SAM-dependent methyltransferase
VETSRVHQSVGALAADGPEYRCPVHPDVRLAVDPAATLVCDRCRTPFPVRSGIARLVPPSAWAADGLREEADQWDQEAEMYEARRAADPRYMAGVEAAARALSARPGEGVLDAGCGTGLTTRRLVAIGCRVTALDLSAGSLGRLRQRVGGLVPRLVQGDLSALPFPDAAFDRVLCANALQQLGADARRACVRELARVLRPGGRLVLTAQQHSVPRRRAGWVKEGRSGDRVRYIYRFTAAEFARLLGEEAGEARVRGAGFPLPYRFKFGPAARVVERAWQRLPVGIEWADLLVGVVTKAD